MKNSLVFLLGMSLLPISSTAQHLLPLPQKLEWHKGNFSVDKPYVIEDRTSEIVSKDSWLHTCKGYRSRTSTYRPARAIIFQNNCGLPSSEAYSLQVSKDTIMILAQGTAGFQYAQSTLQQLLQNNKIAGCTIHDSPAFTWRGVMIDVSRHFYPLSFLKKQIDIMSFYKMNRLHLHLTDAAGWRMEIKRYPRLTTFAAWRTDSLWKDWWQGERRYTTPDAQGAYGGFYTQDELRELVKYAARHQVMVIPEIEMPAHSEEVLTAYPELSCTHEPYKQADFCPGSIATFDFLENVLQEVIDVFPSPYIHIGGDEAGKSAWSSCPLCQQKMREMGMKSTAELQNYLVNHIGQFLNKNGRQLIGWDEILNDQLPHGSQVMVWRDLQHAQTAIQKNYDVILSPGSHCYLDAYQDAPDTQPEAIGGFLSLEKVYSFEPLKDIPKSHQKQVKGIQGNLWTEYVPTTAHAEHMLYPRLLAIAEIAWNGTPEKNYPEFYQRALSNTAFLRQHHINAFDLSQEVGNRPASLRTIKHKAFGAKVTYNRPVNPYYPGNGVSTLTDGQYGGWHHGDGKWQGFIGKNCFDVTVDLGKRQSIKTISTDFLQFSHPDIYFPGHYKISVSDDGKTYKTIYQKEHSVSQEPAVSAQEWGWNGKENCRFIRIEADRGKLGGWIFADEIKVK